MGAGWSGRGLLGGWGGGGAYIINMACDSYETCSVGNLEAG